MEGSARDFNPRTREGCDVVAENLLSRPPLHFNPRTREGCDSRRHPAASGTSNFNPRTREGCDTGTVTGLILLGIISIHAPVKGATGNETIDGFKVFIISIHAPVKGATRIFSRVWKTFLQISIHAPVKGATLFRVPARLRRCSISIHAPVKGATIDCLAISQISIDFNPRTREGCDTLVWRLPHPSILNFNPRTREGCDAAIKCSRLNNFMISIHAPVKGATLLIPYQNHD